MVNRITRNAPRDINKPGENDSFGVTDAASTLSLQLRSGHKREYFSDELIRSLSDAYENKRARQVSEWERAQIRNVYAA